MADPFSLLAAGAGFTISAGRFVAQLSAVKDETGTVIGQVRRITRDIIEAERLYQLKKSNLSDSEQSTVEDVIKDTRLAVNNIAKQVEPARKGVAKLGTVNVVDRIDWILRRSSAAELYQHNLGTCHRSLLDRIGMLRATTSRDDNKNRHIAEEIAWTQEDETGFEENKGNHYSEALGSDRSDTSTSYDIIDFETTSSATMTHPERALYEAMQWHHMRNRKPPSTELHPERVLYEEMQQRHRQGLV